MIETFDVIASFVIILPRRKKQPTIDDVDVDEFIQENTDPIFLHQKAL
jgi:hypothetical protein